jgi:potassium efflux system protein
MQPDRKIRITVKFGVEYGSDIDKVKKVSLDVINKLDILKDPEPQILFLKMGDFSLEFTARFWVDDIMKKLMVMEQATCDIYKALGKSGLKVAYPTSTVYLKKGKK